MRILCIRLSSLGDIVLTTSFLSWLKYSFPKMDIHFLTMKGAEVLLDDIKVLAKVHTYHKKSGLKDLSNLYTYVKSIQKENNFDFVIDLHATTRSFFIKTFMFNIPHLSIEKRRLLRSLFVLTKKNTLKKLAPQFERPMIDWASFFNRPYNDLIIESYKSALGVNSQTLSPISFKVRRPKKIFIAPGASFDAKKYPIDSLISILNKVLELKSDLELSILGLKEEIECQYLYDGLFRFHERIENMQGKLNLSEVMDHLSEAKLIICNDSLFVHLANSANIPVISFFGPTHESFGFSPYTKNSTVFSVKGLSCRPCSTTGKKKCFQSEQFCMIKIDKDSVVDEILKKLEE